MLTPILLLAPALAGPIVEPTPQGVQGGLEAAARIAWLLALTASPFLGFLLHRHVWLRFRGGRNADNHQEMK